MFVEPEQELRPELNADDQIQMFVEPGQELRPELSADALPDAQMVEMNRDQALPQMPTADRPRAAKDDHTDQQSSSGEDQSIATATGDNQHDNDAANHQPV